MKNYTDITVLIDKSGSMCGRRHDTIGGFNSLLDEQRKADGEAVMTLIQFDDQYEVNYVARDVRSLPNLTPESYNPRGSTALNDALAKAVAQTGERLRTLHENDRPTNVLFVLITDGEENSSQEFRGKEGLRRVRNMVSHQEEKYNWKFLFLGANIDGVKAGVDLGLPYQNSVTYDATANGFANAYKTVSSKMATLRSTGNLTAFSHEERAAVSMSYNPDELLKYQPVDVVKNETNDAGA